MALCRNRRSTTGTVRAGEGRDCDPPQSDDFHRRRSARRLGRDRDRSGPGSSPIRSGRRRSTACARRPSGSGSVPTSSAAISFRAPIHGARVSLIVGLSVAGVREPDRPRDRAAVRLLQADRRRRHARDGRHHGDPDDPARHRADHADAARSRHRDRRDRDPRSAAHRARGALGRAFDPRASLMWRARSRAGRATRSCWCGISCRTRWRR